MEGIDSLKQVNRLARRKRHLRVFSQQSLRKIRVNYLKDIILKPFTAILKTPFITSLTNTASSIHENILYTKSFSPQKRLMLQSTAVAFFMLAISSFTTSATATFTNVSTEYSSDYMAAYFSPGEVLVSDDSGYFVKINPQTDSSNRIGLTDYAIHIVESGESLSVISENYGISVETIMWENGIRNANSLRVGQNLMVPPVDGVGYEVKKSDTLDKIAKKYEISVESIIAQNALDTSDIYKGQNLFLPGAEPINIAPPMVANASRNVSTYTPARNIPADTTPSTSTPILNKPFIYPSRGSITQGYHGGHRAIDIADRSMPPIWSAGGGTVIKVSTGTYGGGYGNYVIVDHGDGLETLYAHMNQVYVTQGQYLEQGEAIGQMGNTGRVYGVTGIHLHWEVRQNGVKQNPYDYF